MLTTIFHLKTDGEIEEVSSYTLPPKEALKCAVLQRKGINNTWDYPKLNVPTIEKDGRHYYPFGENESLCAIAQDE